MSERSSSFRHVPVVETMRGVHERIAVASEHTKHRRQELLQQHIQDAQRDFTLRNFLLVLLDQHIISEAEWSQQSSEKHAAHQATIDAVRHVLEALDNGEQPRLPPILQGKIDLSSLRKEKTEFEAEIGRNVVANWNEFAFEIVCRLPFYKQFQALRAVLTAIARGKTPKLPPILEGISWWADEQGVAIQKHLDIPYLRQQWEWFKRNIIDPNKVLAKRTPEANCKEPARQILLGKWPRKTEPGPPTGPWDRIVDKVIGSCSEKGIDAAFVREWVAREGEYAESDPRAAVLFRLDLEEMQYKFLAELRRLFPTEAKEWFDGIQNGVTTTHLGSGIPDSGSVARIANNPVAGDANARFTRYIAGLSAPATRALLNLLWDGGKRAHLLRKQVKGQLAACTDKSWQSRVTRTNARLLKDSWNLFVTERGELIYLDGTL